MRECACGTENSSIEETLNIFTCNLNCTINWEVVGDFEGGNKNYLM